MSVFSEQEPTNPQDLSHYAPRRRGERSGVHLRTVTSSVGETKFDRPFRVDASSSPFAPSVSSLDAQLEEAIGESLRRGGDDVIDVAMAQVAARYAALPPSTSDAAPAERALRRSRAGVPAAPGGVDIPARRKFFPSVGESRRPKRPGWR